MALATDVTLYTRCDPAEVYDALATLLEYLEPPAWQKDALCHEYPSVAFFPGRGEDSTPAKKVCAACLVRQECLDFAMTDPATSGIWGGLSGVQRRALRRQVA